MSEDRIVSAGKYTQVLSMDARGAGNACHVYRIETVPQTSECAIALMGQIKLQNGPIQDNGVNGCMNEDLMAIVIDRLQSFQTSGFGCRENAIALTKMEEALMWLNKRTNSRIARGVEGKYLQ